MAIKYPIVPTDITIHLGKPDEAAKDITVPFVDYLKNGKNWNKIKNPLNF